MATDDERFAQWWKCYPRKVAKQDARRAWAKLHADDELLALMLRALQWQLRTWSELQYVPYPATWLNGRRWEDENPNERRSSAAATIAEVLAQMGMRT